MAGSGIDARSVRVVDAVVLRRGLCSVIIAAIWVVGSDGRPTPAGENKSASSAAFSRCLAMPVYKEGWKFAAIEGAGPALPARSIELPALRRFQQAPARFLAAPTSS